MTTGLTLLASGHYFRGSPVMFKISREFADNEQEAPP